MRQYHGVDNYSKTKKAQIQAFTLQTLKTL